MQTHEGIIWYEKDKENGPFAIRQSGSSNFITKINTEYYSRFGSPCPKVTFEHGWDNPKIIKFSTLVDAVYMAKKAYEIEEIHLTIEALNPIET